MSDDGEPPSPLGGGRAVAEPLTRPRGPPSLGDQAAGARRHGVDK